MRAYDIAIGDRHYQVRVKSFDGRSARLDIDGREVEASLAAVRDSVTAPPTRAAGVPRPAFATPAAPAPVAAGAVRAPIPGAILEIHVQVGDVVRAGQDLLKMEAMKMENVIHAPAAGTVQSIDVRPGDAVSQGQQLLLLA